MTNCRLRSSTDPNLGPRWEIIEHWNVFKILKNILPLILVYPNKTLFSINYIYTDRVSFMGLTIISIYR